MLGLGTVDQRQRDAWGRTTGGRGEDSRVGVAVATTESRKGWVGRTGDGRGGPIYRRQVFRSLGCGMGWRHTKGNNPYRIIL
jgi:hypothetical protein